MSENRRLQGDFFDSHGTCRSTACRVFSFVLFSLKLWIIYYHSFCCCFRNFCGEVW